MRLIFIYGGVAAGKLTVARELAAATGFALFHNHLVVDAVGALFPFGTEPFVRLRERFWLDALGAAAQAGRSAIFTFAPEPTVDEDFPERLEDLIEGHDGEVAYAHLVVDPAEQEARLTAPSRSAFGKLTSLELLRALKSQFDAAEAAMPEPDVVIDTGVCSPREAAEQIVAALGLSRA